MKRKPRRMAGAEKDINSHLNPTRSRDTFQSAHDLAATALYRVILSRLNRLAQIQGR
jgi:hypothetical protein